MLAATGLATRALARQAFADGAATLAGCAALFSGYALFTAYERSAFGELTGGFWIPLLLLFTLRADARTQSGQSLQRMAGVRSGRLGSAPAGSGGGRLLALESFRSA